MADGEHQGENASSPQRYEATVHVTALEAAAGRESLDPISVPGEAVVEAGTDDWWTPGRALDLALTAASAGLAGAPTPDAPRWPAPPG